MTTRYLRDKNDLLAIDANPETGDEGPAYKVAIIDTKGVLKPAKDMKHHMEAVRAFLDESGDGPEEEEDPTSGLPPAKPGIPPCPPEDPGAGDKTPEVVAWMFRYHPEDAAKRYAGRKFTPPIL